MVAKGLAECEDCGKAFEEGDNIYECGECDEIYCETCWKDHNCIEDNYSPPTVTCDECGNEIEGDDAKLCDNCSETLCDSCWDEHCHEHLDRDVNTIDYKSYVDELVKESI